MTDEEKLFQVVRERLGHYEQLDFTESRRMLVEAWRTHHPDAANQPPWPHVPLELLHRKTQSDHPDEPGEVWFNDLYNVTLHGHKRDSVFHTDGGIIQIGISAHDGTARHDWRDMQGIKNELAGPEVEGFELFPAESRVLDPSNYYTIWCFPGPRALHIGVFDPRRVWNADVALAPQRGVESDHSKGEKGSK